MDGRNLYMNGRNQAEFSIFEILGWMKNEELSLLILLETMQIPEALRKRLAAARTMPKIKKNPFLSQERTFNKLLVKAKHTAFGQHYVFEEILSDPNPLKRFRETVPLCNYDTIRAWWARAEAGEHDVCWPGKVKYFALSSGTSGAPSKNIPVTRDLIRATQRASIKQLIILRKFKLNSNVYRKSILTLSGSTSLQYFGNHYKGDVSGIHAKHIPRLAKMRQKPGQKISSTKDWETRLQLMVENAPKWDIGVIAGVPAWLEILMERIEERYGLKTIHEIWPNFQAYIHGGVAIDPYRKKLQKHFSRDVAFVETYLASEGFIALQGHPKAKGMEILADHGIFYEFIPFNEDNFDEDGQLRNPFTPTLTLAETQIGVPYALAMSTCAGAWRYMIGDVVRFVQKDPPEIIIEGRTKHFLSLVGEHLSVDNMTQALTETANRLELSCPEFGVAGIPHEGRFAHHWYIACDDPNANAEQFRDMLDESLKRLNDDYAVERAHALKYLFVTFLPNQKFIDYLAQLGKAGGQSKFPRVLKGNQLESWMKFLNQASK